MPLFLWYTERARRQTLRAAGFAGGAMLLDAAPDLLDPYAVGK
jgi:hypothetical protein